MRAGTLRDDPDQRRIIARIQGLYKQLEDYHPHEIPTGRVGGGWVSCGLTWVVRTV